VFETVASTNSYVKVRSEIGDPIQLSDFHPVACEQLARLGSPNDGGYVVPLDAVRAARALLSFGLSHDWTFERDFKKHNANALIHCYDHTVSLLTTFQYSIGQLVRLVALFRASAFRKAFRWIDYLVFFRADTIHFKQRIWRDQQNNSATIDDVFGRLPAECPVFVKIDIEGSEYRVLDDLLRRSQNITAMAIEFHDVDILTDRFNALVEKIKRDFHIVHIHGNNMGGVAPFQFPIAPEITFLNKRFLGSAPSPSRLKYPIPGLDRPNHPRFPEFTFEF
jgi:FkbM family methyltransferase